VANFLADQRCLNPPLCTEDQASSRAIEKYITTRIPSVAPVEKRVYILRDPIALSDCSDIPIEQHLTARKIDNHCYVLLHVAGPGWIFCKSDIADASFFSQKATGNMADLFSEGSIGTTSNAVRRFNRLPEHKHRLYTCPHRETPPPTLFPTFRSPNYNPLRTCFFNLPIFYVKSVVVGKQVQITPCAVRVASKLVVSNSSVSTSSRMSYPRFLLLTSVVDGVPCPAETLIE